MLSIEYIAGLFDGEGCVCAYRGVKKVNGQIHSYSYTVSVSIVLTHRGLIEELVESVPVATFLRLKREDRNPNWRDCYRWNLYGKRAVEFLRWVRPYLRIKGEAADAAIELFEHIQRAKAENIRLPNNRRRLPPEEIAIREELILRVRAANHSLDKKRTGDTHHPTVL